MMDCLKPLPARVVAACDVDEAKLGAMTSFYNIPGRYTDFNEMLDREKLDAVICVVSPQVNYEVAKACFNRGISLFVEKTPCMNSIQAAELHELSLKNNVYGMVGFNRRFMPCFAMAKEISVRPEFGRLTMFFTRYNGTRYPSEDHYIFHHLIHSVDMTRFFLGEVNITNIDRIFIDEHRVGFHISLVSEDGALGFIQSGCLQNLEYPVERMELTGLGRLIVVDNARRLEYNRSPVNKSGLGRAVLSDEGDTLVWNPNNANLIENDYNGFSEEMEYFVKCLLEKTPPQPDFKDSIYTMRLMEDIYRRLGMPEKA